MDSAQSNLESTAAWYRRFAEHEARGKSALYSELAGGIAQDRQVLELLAGLPPVKRQPNLVLASYRWLHGMAGGWPEFRANLLSDWDGIRETILTRRTQTNEPGRLAALVPILALLPQPLALIEVGASAGLCLFPDRYGFDWGDGHILPPQSEGAPIFPCRADAATPLPSRHPEIAWRAGLDLNPLDVRNEEEMRWLENLVWPGQEKRLERLHAAIAVARIDPPYLRKGDLLEDLAALLAEAPAGATKVVMHTAVLNYVADLADRERFAELVMERADYWVANEYPQVFPRLAPAEPPPREEAFLMTVNGLATAWSDPHGGAIWWLAGS